VSPVTKYQLVQASDQVSDSVMTHHQRENQLQACKVDAFSTAPPPISVLFKPDHHKASLSDGQLTIDTVITDNFQSVQTLSGWVGKCNAICQSGQQVEQSSISDTQTVYHSVLCVHIGYCFAV
jgi:hypothetical protein